MAQLTYLDLVNKVLKRLREDQVTTVSYNTYSALIGEFVNDAKREVEQSWLWNAQNVSIRVQLGVGENEIYLDSLSTQIVDMTPNDRYNNERSLLLYNEYNEPQAWCRTTGKEQRLIEMSAADLQEYRVLNPDALDQTDPINFAVVYSPSRHNMRIDFRDNALEAREYTFRFNSPQEDLADDTDEILIPWAPVVHLAVLYALDERGEEIGEPGSKAWLRYEKALSDAVALDASKDSYKTTFTVP
jgi:hypothetical protein